MNQLVCASSGETPSRTWFQERRDIGGVQATAYAWVKVWFAIRISQLGFDETKIERVPHVDLWCLVKGPDGQVEKVILSAGTVLAGETADDICRTVFLCFERGAAILGQLGAIAESKGLDIGIPTSIDPRALFHKVRSIMHDTCATANLTATKLRELKETSGRDLFGNEEWEAMDEGMKGMTDLLCFNHGRNLLVTEYERLSKRRLQEALGPCYLGIKDKVLSSFRDEADIPSLLHSVGKLMSKSYEKSYWIQWKILRAQDPSPELKALKSLGRVETGTRQDAGVEKAWTFFLQWQPVAAFVQKLRDSIPAQNILIETVHHKMQLAHNMADVHARALMFEFVFDELRARGNLDREEGHMTQVGILNLLQSVLELAEFLKDDGNSLEDILHHLETGNLFPEDHRISGWAELRRNEVLVHEQVRPDGTTVPPVFTHDFSRRKLLMVDGAPAKEESYLPMLRQCLADWGTAMRTSLGRTYRNYLTVDGREGKCVEQIRASNDTDPLPTNDLSESIFAKAKQFFRERPTLQLYSLNMLVMCTMNGWYASEQGKLIGPGFEQSKAISRELLNVIQEFSRGGGRELLRGWFNKDMEAFCAAESKKFDEGCDARKRQRARRAENQNRFSSVRLITDEAEVDELVSYATARKGDATSKLKEQVHARKRFHEWTYPKSLCTNVTKPKEKKTTPLEHLATVLKGMIAHERRVGHVPRTLSSCGGADTELRDLAPELLLTNQAHELAARRAEEMEEARPQDDPELVRRHNAFFGKCFVDADVRSAGTEPGVYQIINIVWRKYGKDSYWCAEALPIELDDQKKPVPFPLSLVDGIASFAEDSVTGMRRSSVEDYWLHEESDETSMLADMERYQALFQVPQPRVQVLEH